jgi:outer membrane lipoprotein carrier protein
MTKKLRYILLILFGTALFAQGTVELPESFRAKFRQTITSDQNQKIIYSGEILFSTPDHFKWSYNSPTKKEVCTDGKELLVVDHDLEQISSYTIKNGLNLPAILKSAKPHRKSVYIAKYRDNYYTIQVNSKGELSRIAFKDEMDNNVLIIFSKMKYGAKKLSERVMQCLQPKRYDRIGG